ncbi:hypothetical protein FGO68_gene5352 [Halteria grandinella]|uniref:Uncharacterized protein n=1 Tax=Halteria grandinella TaxID=5974 RepID=A0A8J8NB61_HALGN|nr:hypothetical protein FGO68_gene5352 [Halteria grandinella]
MSQERTFFMRSLYSASFSKHASVQNSAFVLFLILNTWLERELDYGPTYLSTTLLLPSLQNSQFSIFWTSSNLLQPSILI